MAFCFPASLRNWRMASRKGRLSISPTVPPISTIDTSYPAAVFYGGVAFLVGTNLGYSTGLPAANIMSAALWPGLPVDGNGNPYFYLSANDTIQCTFATSLTSSTYLNVSAVVSDF